MSAMKDEVVEAKRILRARAEMYLNTPPDPYIIIVLNALTAAERERDEAVGRVAELEKAIREAPEKIGAMIDEHMKHG